MKDKRYLTNAEKDSLSLPDELRSDAVFLSAYGYKPKEHFVRMAADEIERLRGK